MDISASLENYLEVIAKLSKEDGYALSNDIADQMDVKRSSVTVALRNLSELDLISYKKYKPITLTDKGRKVADDIIFKHQSIKDFMTDLLGVDEEKADEIACKMEHFIGNEVTNRIVAFSKYIRSCPKSTQKWKEGFETFYREGKDIRVCSNLKEN